MLRSVLRRVAFCMSCSCSTVLIAAAPSTAFSKTHAAEHRSSMSASPACKARSQVVTQVMFGNTSLSVRFIFSQIYL